ncbi:MAG: CDP-alcohol phosphatidyltransferase family protein, partial [Waddliaceae bacterium]|nr:CDP-alcohol phosphatidyltransferase family protein [Waddliaceae bacterium]
MKKISVLPNIITAIGLSFGLFIIFKVTVTDPYREDFFSVLEIVSGLLILAIIADFLDGAMARVLKVESEFGCMFDSLADV